jgi:hypothetical protein
MNLTIKEANQKRKDPFGFELDRIRAEISNMQNGGLKDIAELVFERKVKEIKADILEQLESYVGDVTETLIKEKMRGEKGDKGEKGERGPKGDQGERGAQGERGEMGLPGINGLDGDDGKNGIDGADGRDGLNGRDGRDGATVELEAVLAVVKPEVDKIIEEAKKTIKALRPERQKSGGGASGGGMGSPVTFSFTANGVDTTFALSGRVAANGMAIWAYVNGQWIQPGVHFTIDNATRVLTTTFTPANGDTLEGFFLRS